MLSIAPADVFLGGVYVTITQVDMVTDIIVLDLSEPVVVLLGIEVGEAKKPVVDANILASRSDGPG